MEHRIRAAALIVQDDRILMVQHRHPVTGEEWWVPPGGGMEDEDASIMDCVVREVREETGYRVEAQEIWYLREFQETRDRQRVHFEIFVRAVLAGGHLQADYTPPAHNVGDFAVAAAWLTRQDLARLTIFPQELLEDEFWERCKNNRPGVVYLGRQVENQ